MRPATAIDTAAFARDGYLVIRDLIDPQLLAELRQALADEVDRILAALHADGSIADTCTDLPFERRLGAAGAAATGFGRSWTERLAVPATWALHRDAGVLRLATALLGPVVHGHRQFNIRPKLPGQEMTTVPWHQDTGYYGPETARDTIVTIWVPLVPVDPANGCMQIIPGSHRAGAARHIMAHDAGGFLRIDAPDPAGAIDVPMRPGDALAMHNLLWHRSQDNRSDGIRWSIDMRFWRPGTPSAASLLAGFPAPWVLCGDEPTPVERWMSWYRR